MKYLCPLCKENIVDDSLHFCEKEETCDKRYKWFLQLKGKGLWRIRYLNQYEYQFFTEEDFLNLQTVGHIILDAANHWEDFDPISFTGLNASGQRTSIFEQ